MAKSNDKEWADVYWVCLKRKEGYLRIALETYKYESSSGAIMKYEQLIMENEHKKGEGLFVELLFISEGRFSTLKEQHFD